MATDTYAVELERGEYLQFDITLTEDDVAVDLTGYKGRMQVRLRANRFGTDDEPALELTTENGGLEIEEATGTITVTITAAQAEALNTDNERRVRYVWGLEAYNEDTLVVLKAVGRGTMTVRAEYVR